MISFTVPHPSGLVVYGVWTDEDREFYLWMEDAQGSFVDFRWFLHSGDEHAVDYAVEWVEAWSMIPGIQAPADG